MLRDATSARERALITTELEAAKVGVTTRREKLLNNCRVVGTTTASCGNEVMKGMTFAVVILVGPGRVRMPRRYRSLDPRPQALNPKP